LITEISQEAKMGDFIQLQQIIQNRDYWQQSQILNDAAKDRLHSALNSVHSKTIVTPSGYVSLFRLHVEQQLIHFTSFIMYIRFALDDMVRIPSRRTRFQIRSIADSEEAEIREKFCTGQIFGSIRQYKRYVPHRVFIIDYIVLEKLWHASRYYTHYDYSTFSAHEIEGRFMSYVPADSDNYTEQSDNSLIVRYSGDSDSDYSPIQDSSDSDTCNCSKCHVVCSDDYWFGVPNSRTNSTEQIYFMNESDASDLHYSADSENSSDSDSEICSTLSNFTVSDNISDSLE
jgi:hypothetical protein